MVEPVFLLRRELPPENGTRYDTLEVCLAAEKVSGSETVLGAQEIRGLWRVYPLTRAARSALLIEGIALRQHTVQVHDKNPFILRGQDGVEVPATKLWLSDIPISIASEDIESALNRLGVVARSSLMQERTRNRDGKLTRFLTGRRFIFIGVPEKPLERAVRIGPILARLYYKEQPKPARRETVCSRCLQKGHTVGACENDITCRECMQSGHRRGDPACTLPVNPASASGQRSSAAAWDLPTVAASNTDADDHHVTLRADGASDNDDEWEDARSQEGSQRPAPASATGGKQDFVTRGRQLTKGRQKKKQTTLAFDTRSTRSPKRTRTEVGNSPGSEGVSGKQTKLCADTETVTLRRDARELTADDNAAT